MGRCIICGRKLVKTPGNIGPTCFYKAGFSKKRSKKVKQNKNGKQYIDDLFESEGDTNG